MRSVDLTNLAGAYEKLKYTYGKGAPLLELFQFLTETPLFGGLAKLPVMIVPHIFRVPKNFLLMNQLREFVHPCRRA